ncbi:MAG: zinc ribbon domain-containing protein [Candidatus Methanoculleus thermohydrogenotrophicum]|nr:zinc ribbon domain-containing protein [Candidatus Methanoculleus thermohydrogenotrophicum]NLM82095.1 transposase [Candidatus Methanoculleus thermohydrogenotrophicum]
MTVKKTLSDRAHSCPHCGLAMDRDQNAAFNIMRSGLQPQRCSIVSRDAHADESGNDGRPRDSQE